MSVAGLEAGDIVSIEVSFQSALRVRVSSVPESIKIMPSIANSSPTATGLPGPSAGKIEGALLFILI